MIRDIFDYQGSPLGTISFPDGASEEFIDQAVASYAKVPPSEQELLQSRLLFTAEERIAWAKQMLQRFKIRNQALGINGPKALWLHHRFRALEITCNGVPMTQDFVNLMASGDLETACLTLIYSTPDDGSQAYHWYTTETRQWLMNEIKDYLGWP